jgi:hypothetical protein
MHPILKRGKPNPRGQGVSANATRKGARLGGKVNESELLVNSVKMNKPKALTGLNQKVCGWLIHYPLGLQGHEGHRRIDRT